MSGEIINTLIFISIIYGIFYLFINLSIGLILLRFVFKRVIQTYPSSIILLTGFMLGEGVLSALWLIIGTFDQFKLGLVRIILVIFFIGGVLIWRYIYQLLKDVIKNSLNVIKNLDIIWLIILGFCFFLMFIFALGSIIFPPIGDAEAYYMVLPKIVSYFGTLSVLPNVFEFSQIGILGEMHFAALMLIASPFAAKFFVWLTALIVTGLILVLGSEIGLGIKGKIICLILIFSSPTFTNFIFDGKVDVFSVAFGLLAYYWALQLYKKSLFLVILTGLFLGFSIVAKLSNALVILPGIALIVLWNNYLEIKEKKSSLRKILFKLFLIFFVIGSFAYLAYSPQFIKNAVIYNNPFVNYYSVDKPASWSKPIPTINSSGKSAFFSNVNLVVTYPLRFVFGDFPGKGGNLSILFLVFLPFLFFRGSSNLAKYQIGSMVLLGLVIWLIIRSSNVSPRYILPTLLLATPLIAAGVEDLLSIKYWKCLKWVILVSLLLMQIGVIANHFYMVKDFGLLCINRLNKVKFYGENFSALDFLNKTIAPNQRIFMVGYYMYYLKPDLILKVNQSLPIASPIQEDSEWDSIYNKGFEFVIVQKNIPISWISEQLEKTSSNQINIRKIYSDRAADVYSLVKK